MLAGLVAGAVEVVLMAWPRAPGPEMLDVLLMSSGLHGVVALALSPLVSLIGAGLRGFEDLPAETRRRVVRLALSSTVLVAVVGVVGSGLYVYYHGIIIGAVDPSPVLVAAAVFLFALALYQLLRSSLLIEVRLLMAPAAVLVGAWCALAILLQPNGAAEGAETLANHGITSGVAAVALRDLTDRDGDGSPAEFCVESCDCDDAHAWISPTAVEVPGNGFDDDCYEGDMVLPPIRRVPAPVVVAESTLKLDRPNVLFITIDTLRADHLGCYGYSRNTSPKIDALAKRGTLFKQARAQGPMTRFSVPVLLSGRYFSELERTGGAWPKVLPSNRLLAEIMSEGGYHTAAFHSIGYLMPLFGMDQGFDTYDVSVIKDRDPVHWNATSDLLTDRILEYFDGPVANLKTGTPWLMWAYYGDPHAGYQHHEGIPLFGPSVYDLYDHEIYFTDLHIGRLLEGLKRRGLLDNTVIVLTSDHGEGLNPEADHGFSYHGQTLYDNVLHVPLIVQVPGAAPSVVETPVGNVDVMPTILAAASLEAPSSIHGISLLPYVEGRNPPHSPLFAEKVTVNVLPQKSMLKWPYKLIWKLGVNKFELYDVASDPAELHELSRERPDALSVLKTEFQVWRATVLKEIPASDG